MFSALNFDNSNFLEWLNDAKTIIVVEDLAATLEAEGVDKILPVYKSQTLLILRRHQDQTLQLQYIQVEDLVELWNQLHARLHHQQNFFSPSSEKRLDQP
jgi:hypothetical protein